jgi:gluconolactonase
MNLLSSSQKRSSRRELMKGLAAGLAGLRALPAQGQSATTRDWSGRVPVRYPDPDVISLEKEFNKYRIGTATIERVSTGYRWAEGPAWNGAGNYLVWSDIPNNRQMRWIEEDGHVDVFRKPSNFSNGNTFDWQGRQLSCEHQTRRLVRYEQTGEVTVLAEKFNGKPLNGPNDVIVHPNGDIWFTDPGYGGLSIYEGGKFPLDLKEAVYRLDGKTGQLEMVTDELFKPNGLCFSPDLKKLYVCDTGATHYPKSPREIRVYDIDGSKLRNSKQFLSTAWDNYTGFADGIRADTDGNIWAAIGQGANGTGSAKADGDGVYAVSPQGVKIGKISLPEICANVCFGSTRRNRLFMAASQSIYSLYVDVKGANIA